MRSMRNLMKLIGIIGVFTVFAACSGNSSSSRDLKSDSIGDDSSNAGGESGFTPSDFYRQCSEDVCDFKMYEGERRQKGVATWHPHDTGFSLIGDPVVVSVVDQFASHPEVPVACYKITVLGYWGTDVDVSLEITGEYGIFGMTWAEENDTVPPESEAEGEFEWIHPLPPNTWEPLTFTVKSPKYRGEMTFSIRQTGSGNAIFYLLEVNGQPQCPPDAIAVD